MPVFGRQTQFCENHTILRSKKVNRVPFFSDFSRKNRCSHAQISSKIRLFSTRSSQYLSKKRQLSQKNCNLMSFFLKTFLKNPLLTSPYSANKRQLCQKYDIFWVKKSKHALLFRFFTDKYLFFYPYFVKKRPFSKKHTLFSCFHVHAHIEKKTSILTKTLCSHVHILLKNVHSLK